MSSFVSKIKDTMKDKLSPLKDAKDASSLKLNPIENSELRLVALLTYSRSKYLLRKINGSITISSSLLGASISVSCNVGDEDQGEGIAEKVEEEAQEELKVLLNNGEGEEGEVILKEDNVKEVQETLIATKEESNSKWNIKRTVTNFKEGFSKITIESMDKLLDKLENRAMCWKKTSFAQDVVIDGGFSVSFGAGSISINFGGTAKSLIDSFERKQLLILEKEKTI